MCEVTASEMERAVRALVKAQETNLGIEVTLPVMYANGDTVSVVVTHERGKCLVHDAGFGAMHLASFGAKLNKAARKRLSDIASRYGCEFHRERVSRICTEVQLPMACAVVANASRLIGDQALELRRHDENEFKAQLLKVLKDVIGSRLRQHEMVQGDSGRFYRVDSVILDKNRMLPSAYVVGVASKSVTSNCFAELYDISQAHQSIRTQVIYDPTSDIRQEDLRLLGRVSDPFPLPNARSRLLDLVAA